MTASGTLPPRPAGPRRLTEADAVQIWIARWLKVRTCDLLKRYGCDPRRLYEVWAEDRFPGSRAKAWSKFTVQFPQLANRVDAGLHRRRSRAVHPDQLGLFE